MPIRISYIYNPSNFERPDSGVKSLIWFSLTSNTVKFASPDSGDKSLIWMFGKMNTQIQIVSANHATDAEGFATAQDVTLAAVRAYEQMLVQNHFYCFESRKIQTNIHLDLF